MVTVILLAAYLSTSGTYYSDSYLEILDTNYRGDYIVRSRDRRWSEFKGYSEVVLKGDHDFIVGDCDTKIVVCRIHGGEIR